MDTVEVTCPHCGKIMAISVEHIDVPVHCPHCQGIVQAPRQHQARSVPTAPKKGGWLEADPEEDVPPPPRMEEEPEQRVYSKEDLFRDDSAAPRPAPRGAASRPTEPEEGAAPVVYQRARQSMFVPVLLIFLVPYALAMTGLVAWQVYQKLTTVHFDPLERLPDPDPKDGGPRQIQHDLEVPAQLKMPLHQALQVGDLEVTAEKVQKTTLSELILVLKMRNISRNVEFNPIAESFVKLAPKQTRRPYVFLQPATAKSNANPKGGERIYGGRLDYEIRRDGEVVAVDQSHRLRPGEEMTINLSTRFEDQARVRFYLDNPQDVLWRVQVRRGFLRTHSGQDKSATAVIGVQFNTGNVERF